MKLSIIIPIYNVAPYLRACLDSVVDPSVSDYEIIAINDGSTDSSGAIAAEYAARYPEKVRLLNMPNSGLGHTRNTGLEAASGDYLLFLDSDDTLAPGSLPEMLACLDGGFDVGIFDFVTVNERGRTLDYFEGCSRSGDFTLRDHPEILSFPPNAVNKLWRRSLFTESDIRFPDRMWFEDLATVPRLYLQAETFRALPYPWYLYLQHRGSIMASNCAERNTEIIMAVDTVLDAFRKRGQLETYYAELEYMALYHQLLTSCDRVALIDPDSSVLSQLVEDFLRKFPRYRENVYVRSMAFRHRLLIELIIRRRFRTVKVLMELNGFLRGKYR